MEVGYGNIKVRSIEGQEHQYGSLYRMRRMC